MTTSASIDRPGGGLRSNPFGIGLELFQRRPLLIGLPLAWLIIFLRAPDYLLVPQLMADDGFAFLATSLNLTTWEGLLKLHQGYLNTFCRLVAAPFDITNFYWAPHVFNTLTLIVSGLCFTLFLAKRFEEILPFNWRAGVVLIMILLPAQNHTILWFSATHYSLMFALALFSLIDLAPMRWWGKAGLILLAVITGLSSPFAVVLAPILALKLIKGWRSPDFNLLFALIALIALSVHYGYILSNNAPSIAPNWPDLPLFLARVAGYSMVAVNLLSTRGAEAWFSSPAMYRGAALGIVALFVILWTVRKRTGFGLIDLAGPYLIIAPLLIVFFGQPELTAQVIDQGRLLETYRYFMFPTMFLVLVAARVLAAIDWPNARQPLKVTAGLILVLFLANTAVHAGLHRREYWNWPAQVFAFYQQAVNPGVYGDTAMFRFNVAGNMDILKPGVTPKNRAAMLRRMPSLKAKAGVIKDGKLYFLVNGLTSWADAYQSADGWGGQLPSFTNARQEQLVVDLVKEWSLRYDLDTDHVWIGYWLNHKQGRRMTSTGENISYANWGPGQEERGAGNRNPFAQLWLEDDNWHWRWVMGYNRAPYVVELPLVIPLG